MKMRDAIQELEDEVLKLLLDGDDLVLLRLRDQLGCSKRSPREMTGVGFFTYFHFPESVSTLPECPSFSFGDVLAEVDGLRHGAGFVLHIRNGLVAFLEGYSYNEAWPPEITSFKLSYLNGLARNLASLHATTGWPSY